MIRRQRTLRYLLAMALAAGSLGGLVAGFGTPASADGGIETGVWWSEQQAGNPAPLPPSVPAGGLWVQQRQTGTSAESAVRWPVPDGQTPGTLTLAINQAVDPAGSQVKACATTDAWQPVAGGPLADAPKADCGTFGIVGTLSTDGKSLVFDLSGLTAEGGFANVVLLPGNAPIPVVGASPTDAFVANPVVTTFDVTFLKPESSAVVLGGTPTSDAPTADSSFDAGSTPTFDSGDTTTEDPSLFSSAPDAYLSYSSGGTFTAPSSAGSAAVTPPAPRRRAVPAPPIGVATPVAASAKNARDGARAIAGFVFLALFIFGGLNAGGLIGAGAVAGGGGVGSGGSSGGRVSIYEWPPVRLERRRSTRQLGSGSGTAAGELSAGATGDSPARVGRPPSLR